MAITNQSRYVLVALNQVWWRQQLRAARNASLAKKRSKEVVSDDILDEASQVGLAANGGPTWFTILIFPITF